MLVSEPIDVFSAVICPLFVSPPRPCNWKGHERGATNDVGSVEQKVE